MTSVRLASADDVRAFAGRDTPEWVVEMVAYAAEQDGQLIALGTVFWDAAGRVWVAFDKRGDISAFTMHRLALRTLKHLRDIGTDVIHAECDECIPGADKWLRRLGFRPRVWTLAT